MLLADSRPRVAPFRLRTQQRRRNPRINLFTAPERLDYLKRFGSHALHSSTLQPQMNYFDVPGAGYVAYQQKWGKTIVLGDPVVTPSGAEHLLSTFMQQFPRSTFVQVSRATAEFLHRRYGLYGTQFGQEMHISLNDWTLKGRKREVIRRARNRAAAQDISVSESPVALNADDIESRWRVTRKVAKREIRFLIRPRKMTTDDTRFFYAFKDERPIAFVYLDPIYCDGRIVSYVPNVSAACEEFRQGIFYVMMAYAMEQLQAEGVPGISLGLIPFSLDEEDSHFECAHVRSVLKALFRRSWFYNFKGIHFTKMRFGGDLSPSYFCHNRVTPIADAIRILRLACVI